MAAGETVEDQAQVPGRVVVDRMGIQMVAFGKTIALQVHRRGGSVGEQGVWMCFEAVGQGLEGLTAREIVVRHQPPELPPRLPQQVADVVDPGLAVEAAQEAQAWVVAMAPLELVDGIVMAMAIRHQDFHIGR